MIFRPPQIATSPSRSVFLVLSLHPMNRFYTLSFLLLFGLSALFVGCSAPVAPVKKKTTQKLQIEFPEFNPLSPDLKAQLSDSIQSFFYHRLGLESFHGMILVARNGEVLFEGYMGMANERKDLPFSPETPLHVASISKTVTAVAVLRLVDQNKLQLDEPVGLYLKGFPYQEITVRNLLSHRSGLPYYGYFPREMTGKKPMTNKRILDLLRRFHPKLNFPPNTLFSYCNTNYALLALIVERITGKIFPDAMKQLVFSPLGMDHSFISQPGYRVENQALSYNSQGVLQADTELDPVYGDKNLYTTARDLLRFDKGTYSDAFLSKEMKKEMFRGYSYERPGVANYGLGVRVREMEGRLPYFFHTGWWHGNTGCYVSMRADTVCMIMLSNHYSRKVFAVHALSPLFGNYPFGDQQEKKE